MRRPTTLRLVDIIRRTIRQSRKNATAEHVRNERVMARWTRYVGVFTIILAICALANVYIIYKQLGEMHSGGIDTHNLAVAAHDQAIATNKLKGAGEAQVKALDRLRLAGKAQAVAADKLRLAGESQARAMEGLRGAGEAQARSTESLALNSGKQIAALTETAKASMAQASAAKIESLAISRSADAALISSKATDRLATAGQAQASSVTDSVAVAKEANDIALKAGEAERRPWLEIGMPAPVSGPPTVATDYPVQVTLTNKGRSPAFLVTDHIDLDIFHVSPNLTIPDLDQCSKDCQTATVFPNTGGVFEAGLTYKPIIAAARLTKEEIDNIISFKDVIVLRTRTDY